MRCLLAQDYGPRALDIKTHTLKALDESHENLKRFARVRNEIRDLAYIDMFKGYLGNY